MANEAVIISRFESFDIYAVAAAGLLDGINPCAFTTIVFFISFLALAGYGKREMAAAGVSFTLAVFVAYILIGIGIFKFLRLAGAFAYAAAALNVLIGCFALFLGILNIADYLRYRKTKDAGASLLRLPQAVKNRIHLAIGSDLRQDREAGRKPVFKIARAAFGAGFVVSILESVCTGQVYLPTIAYVLKIPDRHISAAIYLVLYNLAFIIPLALVFIMSFLGVSSGAFSKISQRHFGIVKLATAALFFAFAAILFMT
ncbi:MAG: hypothetical protein WC312_07455 [Candidatus Omnitrophota bacterium]|jgi:hypothetical protein